MEVSECLNRGQLSQRFHNAISGDKDIVLSTPRQYNLNQDFAQSVVRGLSSSHRWLDCRFLYDKVGSQLYEQITVQPEYYPTRTEASILSKCTREIRDLTGKVTLIELGSGSSTKTDHLLRASIERDGKARYVPIDVSGQALLDAGHVIQANRPEVQFIGINGTYQDAMPLFGQASPLMVVFLGSTIGNLNEQESAHFWTQIAGHLDPGDFFLLGVDLVKDIGILEAAYNDAAGVSAQFSLNIFHRMNRELRTDISVEDVEHRARWNEEQERIDISALFKTDQILAGAGFDGHFKIRAGEEILVEISRKFRLEKLIPDLRDFGFKTERVFMDEKQWFALLLLVRDSHQGTS